MSFFGKWSLFLLAAVLLAGGCSPGDLGATDDERDANYVLGKSRVNAMNYPGAIEAFEKALEANPHAAQAHYQLAILYDNEDTIADPAAAIYHYRECLKYDPKIQNASVIADRIEDCKRKLAQNMMALPSTSVAQQQLQKLMEENQQLHSQLAQWQAAYFALKTNPPAAQTTYTPGQNNPPPSQRATSPTPDDMTSGVAARPVATTNRPSVTQRSSVPKRTHTVARGETLASIARSHGLNLTALQAANPGINPKKLKAGQVLNLPPP
jgi:LysM repeat protein